MAHRSESSFHASLLGAVIQHARHHDLFRRRCLLSVTDNAATNTGAVAMELQLLMLLLRSMRKKCVIRRKKFP
jgi:hypothetical protein